MKKNNIDISNLVVSLLIMFIGAFLLLYPDIEYDNINALMACVMGIYGAIKCIQYFFNKNIRKKDYEHLYTVIACLLAGVAGIIFYENKEPLSIALILMGWVAIMSVIKLIKVDYLMDRHNELWRFNIVTLSLFITIGLLCSMNLYYNQIVQTLVIGFFFYINGLLDVSSFLVDILIRKLSKYEDKKNNSKVVKKRKRKNDL